MTVQTDRRRVLRWMFGAALAVPFLGCKTTTSTDGTSAAGNASCAETPEETAGPYPGDGSNGPNALALSGIVRSDMRTSIGDLTGTAAGIPLTVTLTVGHVDDSCAPLAGYAVYLWHCDQDGKYSMYDLEEQNYLRGVQETDDNGQVTFTTIFPGCYAGRMPHMHFEIYPSLAKATAAGNKINTSQLALPTDVCEEVYATAGYEASVKNLASTSFDDDNVFRDGVDTQLATVTGSTSAGFAATLTVGIKG